MFRGKSVRPPQYSSWAKPGGSHPHVTIRFSLFTIPTNVFGSFLPTKISLNGQMFSPPTPYNPVYFCSDIYSTFERSPTRRKNSLAKIFQDEDKRSHTRGS